MANPVPLMHYPATGQLLKDQFVPMINNAATTYGVPDSILTGVFGMETNYGANVTTSSGGAVGLMQFLPSTARSYGYPLTNNPTPAQAQAQFNAAAKYLSTLYKQYGNWQSAIQHYSGGGYGLSQVQSKARQPVLQNEAVAAPIIPTPNVSGWVGQLTSWLQAAGIRVGEILLGALLIGLGLRALTGGSGNPITVTTTAARKVTKHV
jgi:soluble lytic murein transglycosylase-like protein